MPRGLDDLRYSLVLRVWRCRNRCRLLVVRMAVRDVIARRGSSDDRRCRDRATRLMSTLRRRIVQNEVLMIRGQVHKVWIEVLCWLRG